MSDRVHVCYLTVDIYGKTRITSKPPKRGLYEFTYRLKVKVPEAWTSRELIDKDFIINLPEPPPAPDILGIEEA
jgi:hypothetical protein